MVEKNKNSKERTGEQIMKYIELALLVIGIILLIWFRHANVVGCSALPWIFLVSGIVCKVGSIFSKMNRKDENEYEKMKYQEMTPKEAERIRKINRSYYQSEFELPDAYKIEMEQFRNIIK